MKLPLVDEVRAARQALAEAQAAVLDLARADAALTSLDVIERQRALGAEAPAAVPGADLVAELAARWPALAGLAAEGGAHPFAARRAQLAAARAHLAPIARTVGAAAVELHELQHRQVGLLESPAYAAEMEEVRSLTAERDRLLHQLVPLEQQLGVVRPLLDTIDGFAARIAGELALRGDDPEGIAARRAAGLLGGVLRSVGDLLVRVGLEATVPALDPPEHAPPERIWDEVARARDDLLGLRAALAERIARIGEDVSALVAERERLDARLLERMG